MSTVFVIGYLVGVIGTVVVGRARAGLTQRGRLSAATIALSIPWFLTQIATMFVWPVVLVVWLARGRPRSRWASTTGRNGTVRVVRVGD